MLQKLKEIESKRRTERNTARILVQFGTDCEKPRGPLGAAFEGK